MEQPPARILMADDEEPIRMTMSAILRRRGYAVTAVENGEAALALVHQQPFDLLLLDLKMPGLSGIDVARRARELQPDAAIIVLTGHGSLDSALEGIHVGVFDYLLKTSSPQDVLARVAAALEAQTEARRKQRVMTALQGVFADLGGVDQPQASSEKWLEVGDLQVSTWNQTVRRGDQMLSFTPTEFRILLCLAQQVGQVMTYSQIVQCAQGYTAQALEASELIKPHMYHIRQKIELDPSNPRYILTVRGTGYMLALPPAAV
ncbi:MAG: response regulator transcription factor [Herpetosiphonaceae bacterium]|nr:response regulator transcription factor [Herpetosiphonaceae bacterium]